MFIPNETFPNGTNIQFVLISPSLIIVITILSIIISNKLLCYHHNHQLKSLRNLQIIVINSLIGAIAFFITKLYIFPIKRKWFVYFIILFNISLLVFFHKFRHRETALDMFYKTVFQSISQNK